MLKVNNIDVYYGAIHAIKDVSLEVPDGEIVTLIGSNGAGKSTTLHTISGLIKPKNGSIIFEDKNIVGVPAHKIVGMGLCQVPEGRHVFANMTVMENLELGAYLRSDKAGIAEDLDKIFKKFPRQKPDFRHAFRRRAANAGYGPRPDEPPAPFITGRAFHGPCPVAC